MHRKIANGKILEILFEMYMMPYVPVGIKETKKKKKIIPSTSPVTTRNVLKIGENRYFDASRLLVHNF